MNETIIAAIISSGVVIISMIANMFVSIFAPRKAHKKQKLFDTQWEVLAKMYELISEADSAFELHMSPLNEMRNEEEQKKINEDAANTFNNMTSYYLRNKVFMPLEVASKLESLIKRMHDNIRKYDRAKNGKRNDKNYDKMYEIWGEQRDGKIKEIKNDIEKSFRKILEIK